MVCFDTNVLFLMLRSLIEITEDFLQEEIIIVVHTNASWTCATFVITYINLSSQIKSLRLPKLFEWCQRF